MSLRKKTIIKKTKSELVYSVISQETANIQSQEFKKEEIGKARERAKFLETKKQQAKSLFNF